MANKWTLAAILASLSTLVIAVGFHTALIYTSTDRIETGMSAWDPCNELVNSWYNYQRLYNRYIEKEVPVPYELEVYLDRVTRQLEVNGCSYNI